MSFPQFHSSADISFWNEISKRKLDIQKLDEKPYTIYGSYKKSTDSLFLSPDYMNDVSKLTKFEFPTIGRVINVNTIETFNTMDKTELLKQEMSLLKDDINSGRVLKNPYLLSRFFVLCFCDLKTHVYKYWFSQPFYKIKYKVEKMDYDVKKLFPDEPGIIRMISSKTENEPYFIIKNPKDSKFLTTEPLSQLDKEDTVFGCNGSSKFFLHNFLTFLSTTLKYSNIQIVFFSDDKPSVLKFNLDLDLDFESLEVSGDFVPKEIHLSKFMDPIELASESHNLNLKLMKWREMPDLDLERISSKKCLLIGAGTLGTSVARCLMGWGFKHINFIDNGKISFSNPIRQSLYKFSDHGLPKAETASKALKEIFPKIESTGFQMTIPMPGHPSEDAEDSVKKLEKLVEFHDVIFLLTDTRESRWLPTLLGKKHGKIVINSALGFDKYLVMRHSDTNGCYFCTDIVSPQNSTKDRTMDQQCTVTRPGLAPMAGALAVEMLVSFLNDGDLSKPSKDSETPCQLRGSFSSFKHQIITGTRFPECIGCSDKMLGAYSEKGHDLIIESFTNPKILEKITGLLDFKDFDIDFPE
jgi:ubiquitin-like modifier-activating enzyme ATG7